MIEAWRNISVTVAGYIGCIRNLQLGPTNKSVDFIVDSLDGLNITKCPSMDTCASQPCINGGTCVQEVNECFTCLYPDHYTGMEYTGPILEFPMVLEVRKCAGHIGIKFPLYGLHLIYRILMHISFSAG